MRKGSFVIFGIFQFLQACVCATDIADATQYYLNSRELTTIQLTTTNATTVSFQAPFLQIQLENSTLLS